MIILSNTTDKLEVTLGASITTNQLRCVSSWRDITTTAYTPGRVVINTNNTSDVDISGSPASSTQRVVDMISIYNLDTVSATVTIKFDANGTEYILFKSSIASGERIEYSDGNGFRVFTAAGALKSLNVTSQSASGTALNVVVLGSDKVNNDATANTMADVGLSISVTNTKYYYFRAVIGYTSDATTTGSRWGVNHPGGVLRMYSNYSLNATAITNNQGVSAVDTPAAASATSSSTTGNIAVVEGFYEATADGTFAIRFASEVSGSAITAKAGSILQWQLLN